MPDGRDLDCQLHSVPQRRTPSLLRTPASQGVAAHLEICRRIQKCCVASNVVAVVYKATSEGWSKDRSEIMVGEEGPI